MTKILWHIRQFGPTQALQMRLQGWSEAVTHSFLLVCPFGRRGAPPSCSCRRVMTCFRALAIYGRRRARGTAARSRWRCIR